MDLETWSRVRRREREKLKWYPDARKEPDRMWLGLRHAGF
jgi:hypothetical protein